MFEATTALPSSSSKSQWLGATPARGPATAPDHGDSAPQLFEQAISDGFGLQTPRFRPKTRDRTPTGGPGGPDPAAPAAPPDKARQGRAAPPSPRRPIRVAPSSTCRARRTTPSSVFGRFRPRGAPIPSENAGWNVRARRSIRSNRRSAPRSRSTDRLKRPETGKPIDQALSDGFSPQTPRFRPKTRDGTFTEPKRSQTGTASRRRRQPGIAPRRPAEQHALGRSRPLAKNARIASLESSRPNAANAPLTTPSLARRFAITYA